MMNGYNMGTGSWILMVLVWMALLAIIVWAVMRIVPGRAATGGGSPERPLEILDRRLAHGEIDANTYDQLRAKLTTDVGKE